MFRSNAPATEPRVSVTHNLSSIRQHMAEAMIGSTVQLLVNAQTVARGVVTGVMTEEAGSPQLIVGGARYDLSQILTATPASFS